MNRRDDGGTPVPAAEIDRLVDGDLGDAERRELLLKLGSSPDGWRRCALAFLEDQALRDALSGPRAVEVARPAVIPIRPAPRRRWLASGRAWAASAVAASFAVGFAAGGVSRVRPESPAVAVAPVEKVAPAPEVTEDAIRRVGWVNLVDRSAGEAPPQRVPVLAGPGLDESWLREQAPAVPEYVRAQWERRGYQVEERRRLVPLALEDGRRVSIPVDEVAFKYVGPDPL